MVAVVVPLANAGSAKKVSFVHDDDEQAPSPAIKDEQRQREQASSTNSLRSKLKSSARTWPNRSVQSKNSGAGIATLEGTKGAEVVCAVLAVLKSRENDLLVWRAAT